MRRDARSRTPQRLAWAGAFVLGWILSTWALVALDGLGPGTNGGMTHGQTIIAAVCIALMGATGLGIIAAREWRGIVVAGALLPVLLFFFVVLDSAAAGGNATVMSWPLFTVGVMIALAVGARLGGRLGERIGGAG